MGKTLPELATLACEMQSGSNNISLQQTWGKLIPWASVTSGQKTSRAFESRGYPLSLSQKQGFTLAVVSGLSLCPLARAQALAMLCTCVLLCCTKQVAGSFLPRIRRYRLLETVPFHKETFPKQSSSGVQE